MCGDHNPVGFGPQAPAAEVEPFPWHIGAFDVHCHCAERVYSLADLPKMKARSIAVMATRCQDQPLVEDMAAEHGLMSLESLSREVTTIVPGFGRHPWFSHELYDDSAEDPTFKPSEDIEYAKGQHYKAILAPEPEDPEFWHDLPTPIPLSEFISQTRERLNAHPLAIVGEIGLDKAFRLAMHWGPDGKKDADPTRTPGGRQRRVSPHHIKMSHQITVLKAQLQLAGEMNRPVSIHGVQVHGILYDLLVESWKGHEKSKRRDRKRTQTNGKGESEASSDNRENAPTGSKPYPPRICLHSFSGKAEAVKQYLRPSIPAIIFFSFSKSNNLRDEASRKKIEDAVKAVPDHQILAETDFHVAGEQMDAELEETYRAICEFKGWSLEEGVRIIGDNFRNFIFGVDGV